MTEYFSTEKSNLNNLISKTSSNDIRRESNSKIQNNTENRKRGLRQRKEKKLQTVLNYTNKDINEKHSNNNGNIIMSLSTNSTGNNDHNSGYGYRDEEVNSKSNKTEKLQEEQI